MTNTRQKQEPNPIPPSTKSRTPQALPMGSAAITERLHRIIDWVQGIGPSVEYHPFYDYSLAQPATNNQDRGVIAGELLRTAFARKLAIEDVRSHDDEDRLYERALATAQMHIFLPTFSTHGLHGTEWLTDGQHDYQNLQELAVRIAYVISKDERLREMTERLVRTTVAAYNALADPVQLFVAGPGTRFKRTRLGQSGGATAFLRTAAGLPMRIPPYPHDALVIKHDGPDIAARIVRVLQQLGDPLLNPKNVKSIEPAGCLLWNPVTVYRYRGGHLAIADKPSKPVKPGPGGEVTRSWAKATYGHRTLRAFSKAVEFGTNWETPPPEIPRGAVEIRFPGPRR